MNLWSKFVIVLGVVGIILIIIGGHAVTLFSLIGTFLFSSAGVMIGLEAIKTRRFILTSRYDRKQNETYYGIAAIIQGSLLIITAAAVFGLVLLVYLNTGKQLFQFLIRRPGIFLFMIGFILSLSSISTFLGFEEQKTGAWLNIFLELFASRLLPGIILLLLSIGLIIAGVTEIIFPNYFDGIGGEYLELLFLRAE